MVSTRGWRVRTSTTLMRRETRPCGVLTLSEYDTCQDEARSERRREQVGVLEDENCD